MSLTSTQYYLQSSPENAISRKNPGKWCSLHDHIETPDDRVALFSELKRRNVLRVSIAYLVVAWLIMQVGDTLALALFLPGWVISLLAFCLILGFPVAVLFAWAYEITPEGVKREKDVDPTASITQLTGRKLDFIIVGLLIAAIGYFAISEYLISS